MPDPGHTTSTHSARRIDPTALQGDWINTESSPRGLARILIERRSDAIAMLALGVEGSAPEGMGWFESRALYASSSTGGDAVAFIAKRDSDSMPIVELHANLSKGLLIVSSFQTRLLSDGPERRSRENSSATPIRNSPGRRTCPRRSLQSGRFPPRPRRRPSADPGGIRTRPAPASCRSRLPRRMMVGPCASRDAIVPTPTTGGRPRSRFTTRSGRSPNRPRSRPAMTLDRWTSNCMVGSNRASWSWPCSAASTTRSASRITSIGSSFTGPVGTRTATGKAHGLCAFDR
jgi:hypothetical protein